MADGYASSVLYSCTTSHLTDSCLQTKLRGPRLAFCTANFRLRILCYPGQLVYVLVFATDESRRFR